MEAPDDKSAINRYQLKEQHLLHRYKEPRQNYDLMGIVFVYLGNSKVKDQMMNLLDLTQEEEGDLEIMCNLGEGLYEEGKLKGKLESVLEMLKDGVSLEKVAQYTQLSLSKIKELAKQNKLI